MGGSYANQTHNLNISRPSGSGAAGAGIAVNLAAAAGALGSKQALTPKGIWLEKVSVAKIRNRPPYELERGLRIYGDGKWKWGQRGSSRRLVTWVILKAMAINRKYFLEWENNMLKFGSVILIMFLMASFQISWADTDAKSTPLIPDYIRLITATQDLLPYLIAPADSTRIQAVLRLTEIAGPEAYDLLIKAFEDEKYQSGTDPVYGVKYYALLGIGKIADANSERFLSQIAITYSRGLSYSRTPSSNVGDSLVTIEGALEGLNELNSPSARDLINKIYSNDANYWLIRLMARSNLLKDALRNETMSTAADSAHFLINGLKNYDGSEPLFLNDRSVNEDYIIRESIESIIFQNRSSLLPYFRQQLDSVGPNNPRAEYLLRQIKFMENNPPLDGYR